MKTKPWILIILLALILLIGILILRKKDTSQPTDQPNTTQEVVWSTYKNDKYNFELQYPSDWQVNVDESGEPKINIYKKTETQKPPFIHHSNVTQVSIFPQGIGTEGVQAQTAPSTINFQEKTKQAIDFLLKDGSRFATYANFETPPKGWEPWGFAWAGVKVENVHIQCVTGSKVISESNCDFGIEFDDAETVWTGSISAQDRAIEVKILESFHFLK